MPRGVWQALNCLSIHATYCVIVAGASPGKTKMRAAVRENGDFFALAVRITGKLLKIDGYILQGVWLALNCLFIYATFCVITTGASPGQTKNEGRGTYKWRYLPRDAMHNPDIFRHAVSVRLSDCHVRVSCQNE